MKIRKILLVAACFAGLSTSLVAQNAGRFMLSGSVDLSFSTKKNIEGNVSTVDEKATVIAIIPSLHYFINDNWAIGAGIGYEHTKGSQLNNKSEKLFDSSNAFVFNPSVYYYLKLSDKFYFTPQLYVGMTVGNMEYDLEKNSNYKMPCNQWEVGLSILNFEFRPTKNIGLNVACGSLAYEHYSVKDIPTLNGKTNDISDGQFRFKLQDSFSFAFRYYFN